jgi:outer membrane protein assembly factor BamD
MKHLLLIVISLLLLNSCSKFQHHMKSTDMEAKYEAAVKYYEKKDYYHALQLFEELISVYRGTSKAEKSYYYYVYCTYYVDDFTMAAYHFNNFVQSYPSSTYAEEMQYMYAYCYYLDSPVSSLDQTSTYDAIDKFQLFINKFPNSKKVEESNKYIDELRLKLEVKSFDNAKLYYRTENYKAAVVAFSNLLKDFPYTIYKEEALFLSLRSSYLYAINSVESKRAERLKLSLEEYYKLVDNFSQSKYLREAERTFEAIQKELGEGALKSSGIN